MSVLKDVESFELMAFADSWQALGDSVQSQIRDVIDNPSDCEGVNRRAIEAARDKLGHYGIEEINDALDEFLAGRDVDDTE